MPTTDRSEAVYLSPLAAQLYKVHREAIYRRTDRMFALLMGIQWVVRIVSVLVKSPRTWIGTASRDVGSASGSYTLPQACSVLR